MITEGVVRENLGKVMIPGAMRNLAQLNLIHDINVSNGSVNVKLRSTALNRQVQDWLEAKVKEVINGLNDQGEVVVGFDEAKAVELNEIGKVIAVMSGKGGVGKSLVASLTAIALRRQGYEVGILDADITGPTIPKMFGITARPMGSENGVLPVTSKSGISVMSINLLLPNEDDAVIWRGPLIAQAITQFWEEVLWGRLDCLVVDLPPGTADAPLTVMQKLPISGVIIVFTPQDLTTMIVRKAAKMAEKMDKPVLGVVENMSYLYVPEIDKRLEIFGKSRGDEMAAKVQAPLLGRIPIDPSLAQLCDEGNTERYDSEIVDHIGRTLTQLISSKEK